MQVQADVKLPATGAPAPAQQSVDSVGADGCISHTARHRGGLQRVLHSQRGMLPTRSAVAQSRRRLDSPISHDDLVDVAHGHPQVL